MAWNWQRLELEQSDVAFIIDETNKKAYRYLESYSEPRQYNTLEDLWRMVEDFLRSLGLLIKETIPPNGETDETSSIWKSVAGLLKRFWHG